MKLPAIQFYPGDWRKDVGVQSLTFHDRGVWFEILCLMHESERRGVLTLNGRAMTEEALARLLGLDKQILNTTLTTILDTGVASRCEETGALLSRRMVRDENLRRVRTEAGKLGGNPALLKQTSTYQDKQRPTTRLKQIRTPSSSSSSLKQHTSTDVDGERYVAVWNENCGSLPKVLKFTNSRLQKLRCREREGLTLAGFRDIVLICAKVPFLNGQGERGWTVSFDYLLENDTHMTQILEGKYGQVEKPKKSVPSLLQRERENVA